ncbi:uncharacterized protein BDR25DRAFT_345585 [Lindgomyces ingoldianus]|uniref:Uncharacterized protein n=1 Tax=Lindgomyces ingoldianus TaxID=673940 RepID=A0ACB6QHK4_9PLEO|nr:uncharacterized protein BDR25DRAFT_345585 [Lindgomyces ingoldianus]KAF2466367.1 hypothetical protein BDR25DRAFT_345585 [Lindgomyces ingoldianus]
MYFSRSFMASALVGFAAATTHAGAASTVAASESMAMPMATAGAAAGMVNTHVVQVGGANGSLVFSPSNVVAEPGDLVQFQFNAKNHSVIQSTFDQPCIPIQNVMANKTDAFYSGFMPTTRTIADNKNVLTYTVRVMNKTPMWYYCGQAKHCQAGMVGSINAATSGNKTIEAFKALAASASEVLIPGQTVSGNEGATPSGAASSAAGGEAGASATAGAGGAATTSTSNNPAQQSTNASPGRLSDSTRQSFLGLGLGAFVSFLVL